MIPFNYLRSWAFYCAFLGALGAVTAHAQSMYTGASAGNWSVDTNWTPTGVPNGVGAAVGRSGTGTITTQDLANVTVGSISMSSSTQWRIDNTNNTITMNQDGTGSGTALISNSGTNRFWLNGGNLVLDDDLRIVNTATFATDALYIAAVISGNHNVTINNSFNSPIGTTTAPSSSVRFDKANTFTGNVTIERGTVTFFTTTSLGNTSNLVSLATVGAATLEYYGSAATPQTIAYNYNVGAAGAAIGVRPGSETTPNLTTSVVNFIGNVNLDGDLTLVNGKSGTGIQNMSGQITGTGGIIANGGRSAITHADNTYSGGTEVALGELNVAASAELGTGDVLVRANAFLNTQSETTFGDDITLVLEADASLYLNFGSGTTLDTIGSLSLDGGETFADVGTWGSMDNVEADFHTSLITGNGLLNVTAVPEPGSCALLLVGLCLPFVYRRMRSC